MKILKPDMYLLEGIEEVNLKFESFINTLIFEVEENQYNKFKGFFERWGGGEALEELLFFMVNFVYPSDRIQWSKNLLNKDNDYFNEIEPFAKIDFSKIENVKLNFGKGINYDVPQRYLKGIADFIEQYITSDFDHDDKPSEAIREKVIEIKNSYKSNTVKSRIQKATSIVEAIIKAKNPASEPTKKDIGLCTYAIFYDKGYRLNFDGQQKEIKKEINPFDPLSFEHEKVSKNLWRA